MTLEEFIEKVCARPLPQNPMARVRTLAKELAEGAANSVWKTSVVFSVEQYEGINWFRSEQGEYLLRRWDGECPSADLLLVNGYIELGDGEIYVLLSKAFDLLEEVEPTNIFISYKRSESSAFALSVLYNLKQAGLEPFVDLDLVPGEDWHAGLKERIQKYDYLIALLGKESLKSDYVVQEIAWALEGNLQVIPICHNGFKYDANEWSDLRADVRDFLGRTHYIPVEVESAAGYYQALTLLLNRFGITP